MNDHGQGAKGTIYEQGSRTIQYIRYPPLFGNESYLLPTDFITSQVDLAAVLFDLVSIEDDDRYEMDGVSWIHDVLNEINDIENYY